MKFYQEKLVNSNHLNYNTEMNDKGTLYVVATPIGNLQDITLRAIDTLRSVDSIVCEDTRVTSILLNKYDIHKPLISVNEYNEEQTVYSILGKLDSGNVALVSDAGTPLISDPGYRLVSLAKKKGFNVIPIPGPSALIAALSASALPTDKFVFLGFLPKTPSKALASLQSAKPIGASVILYEAPHRLLQTLKNIQEVYGDIEVTLAREITKKFEEIKSQMVSDHLKEYASKNPRGEFVILFSAKS